MRRRLPGVWPATVGGLSTAVLCLSYAIDHTLARATSKSVYVPPVAALSALPGSLKAVCADALYVRGVLAIAEEDPRALAYAQQNLQAALALDPGLSSAYVLGGVVAPRGTAEIPEGIRFLKECAMRRPQEWRIPFWMGFDYLQLGDDLKAAEAYRLASSLPDAPPYVRGMTVWEYYQAGKHELALIYLQGIAQATRDPAPRQALERKIAWLSRLVLLEETVRAFHERAGRWPMDLQELVRAGLLDQIPDDPFGDGYHLDEAWYKHPGRVRSRIEHRVVKPPAERTP